MKKITQPENKNSDNWKKKLFIGVIVLILLWGIALRIVELINGNFLFGHDHGRDYLAAYNIVENHKLTLIGAEAGSGVAGINGIFHGPGYFYLISLAYILFHGNPIGAQIFMLLFGIAAMILASWVGYKIMGTVGSVLMLFFVAVSPLIVSQSRFIWSSHPITVFVIFALYCTYRIADKPKVYAPLSVFIAAFTYHSQLGVAVPLVFSILLSIPLVYSVRDWKIYFSCFVSLILAFFPMIYFDTRHGFMATKSAIAYISSGGSVTGSMFSLLRVTSHVFDYWNNFYNTFTFEFGWIPWSTQMIFLYTSLPFVVLTLFMVKERKLKQFIHMLVLMCMFTWISYYLLNNTVWDYYLTHTRIAYIFFYTIAGVTLYHKYQRNAFVKLGIFVYSIFFIVLCVGSVFRMYISYTQDIRDYGVYEKIQGKRFVLDTIYKDAEGLPFSVFIFIPSVYTWPYDYLFKTYGKQTYGYEPGSKKKSLAYLIIEPDLSQPWRQKGWLETVVQGGSLVWEKTILNGLILIKKEF